MIHTGFRTGKRVFVILKDGTKFQARYRETKSGRLFFFDRPPVSTDVLRSVTIARDG